MKVVSRVPRETSGRFKHEELADVDELEMAE